MSTQKGSPTEQECRSLLSSCWCMKFLTPRPTQAMLTTPHPRPRPHIRIISDQQRHHQSCLDAAFGMVYEQLRQKAFCRGTATGNAAGPTSGSARHQARSVAATTTPTAAAAAEVAVGGLRASSEGAQSGRAAVPLSQSGEAATAAAAAAVAVGDGGGGVGFVSAAPAVAEREESAQVRF